jgi:hypothetical protein
MTPKPHAIRIGAVFSVCSALIAAGCGGGGMGSATQARAVALAYVRAAHANDASALCAVLSSAAQSEIEIGGTCEQALAGGLAGFDGPLEQFDLRTLKLSIHGVTGHASVAFTGARSGVFHIPLIRQNGAWLVASALTWR